ncbi:MAG: hypothetical protein IKL02_06830 [Kiritimatiellae bacterium]|nr:hypothetical protein [Kiritimatiellia bacterium]
MKKRKKSIKKVLLTTILATLSLMGGCTALKQFKKVPTPEELWARDKEIRMEIKRTRHPTTHVNPKRYIKEQRD